MGFLFNDVRLLAIVGLAILTLGCELGAQTSVRVVVSPPTDGQNNYYVGNRPPLLSNPLIKLPVGTVRPEGWLRRQLELEAEGFTGHPTEISEFCKFEGSAWASPQGIGHHGWEELPYWLKGFGDLGYVLGDKRIIGETKKWIDGILSTQRPNGYFGPESNLEAMDLWPNMPALHALRSYYEFTGDERVLTLMTNYFRWLMTIPLEKYYHGSWQKIRGGDKLDSVYWLYNRTGEKWLLDLARVNHERTSDWAGGLVGLHGVNIAQCFREPAVYYQQTLDKRYLSATERNYDTVIGEYGQVPGGMFGADENARPGFTGPRQASETCAMVEFMYSHEILTSITGDVKWADRCEDVAFNSFPASMTPDLKGLHYLTAPNQIQLDRENKAPMIQNGGDMFSYNPWSYRCCQHNVAMGWPYFTEHLWMATRGNGLAAVMYAPCMVTAKVGDGQTVEIAEKTDYPFGETVSLQFSTDKPVKFGLYMRIPGWCTAPKVSVNGKQMPVPTNPKGWLLVERTWRSGDTIRLTLPMEIRAKVWEKNRNAISIYRGPLAYSLKIGEDWRRYGGTDEWPAFEVFPTTAWNYGLVVDPNNPGDSVRVDSKVSRIAPQPFTPDTAPVTLRAKAKKIPLWKQESNGMVGELQKGPIRSEEPEETVTLIPMGCGRLRISAFPIIGTGSDALDWPETTVTISASHIWDFPSALNDEILPAHSNDQSIPRFTWWDHRGTSEWVQYTFTKPRKIGSCAVYWFDDAPTGGLCRVPASWKVLWWDGSGWKEAEGVSEYGVKKDQFNEVTFVPVETTEIRLEVQLRPGVSGGILEWRLGIQE